MPYQSSFCRLVIVVLGILIPGFTKAQNRPFVAQLTPGTVDSLRTSILKDRSDTESWLKSEPSSYLAAVARTDFGDRKTMTVGRNADCDLRIDDPEIGDHHLQVTVVGDSFHVTAMDDTARFKSANEFRRDAMLGPAKIGIGRFLLGLSHQRFPAIIVFDPKSPYFANYHGLKFFPVDFSYRFDLSLTPNPKADTVIIMSTRGNRRRALRIGWFDFAISEKPCRLEVDRLLEPGVGENDLSIFFQDLTTGKESYSVGRYVDVEKKGDRYVIDFNSCYNPACAISNYYNCPIPPKVNRLGVAIRAGEMDSHYH
jgi:uncharacterized protein (DUF1684 family)